MGTYLHLTGGTGDWGILLLASLGDRKERTIFPSNVEPTEFYTCYNRFDIVLGRATILGRWVAMKQWCLGVRIGLTELYWPNYKQ